MPLPSSLLRINAILRILSGLVAISLLAGCGLLPWTFMRADRVPWPGLCAANEQIIGPKLTTSRIRGEVVDFEGRPLPRVDVYAALTGDSKTAWHVVTNDRGQFAFPRMPEGKYWLSSCVQGFNGIHHEVTVRYAAAAPSIEIRMLLGY